MGRTFQGRVVTPGETTAPALVSHGGFNTLASYQMALMFGDKEVKCGDQNNPDLYKKPMLGKALCLPETIGSTTGMLASVQLAAKMAPEAARESMGLENSMQAGWRFMAHAQYSTRPPVVEPMV